MLGSQRVNSLCLLRCKVEIKLGFYVLNRPFTYRIPEGVQKIAIHIYGHTVIIGHPFRTLFEESLVDVHHRQQYR